MWGTRLRAAFRTRDYDAYVHNEPVGGTVRGYARTLVSTVR
jgi:hypothetical protein